MPIFENNRIFRDSENCAEPNSELTEVLHGVESEIVSTRSWVDTSANSVRAVERVVRKFGASLAFKTRTFFSSNPPKRNPLIFRLLRFYPELPHSKKDSSIR